MSQAIAPPPLANITFGPPQAGGNALVQAVDSAPETRGMGVVLIANGSIITLRPTQIGQSTVVFEYRPSPVLNATPAATAKPRSAESSPTKEWVNLGLNCGGAALAWVGVVGTAATAPVTGGQSLWATAFLWGGALASSASCGVAVARVGAMSTGHDNINQAMDANGAYVWTMRGLDVVGLLGAGGAIKDIVEAKDAVELSGVGWRRGLAGTMSRQQRKVITTSMELLGSRRVPGQLIGAVLKNRLLAAVAAAVGMGGSAGLGAAHDLVIWILAPDS